MRIISHESFVGKRDICKVSVANCLPECVCMLLRSVDLHSLHLLCRRRVSGLSFQRQHVVGLLEFLHSRAGMSKELVDRNVQGAWCFCRSPG